jgi:hypothetical protein
MRSIVPVLILVMLVLDSGGLCAQTKIKKWPDDVPCDAIRKNPDGSYTQIIDLMMGSMPMPKRTYSKDSAETRAWDSKCAGETG